jgi:putative nucleotidyltransferase with HDIG domain
MAAENLRVLESRRRERAPWKVAVAAVFGPRFRRIALFVGFLGYACLLFPRDPSFEVMTLREGYPAKRDLIAPFQFSLLKDKNQFRVEQAIAARRVAPVYSVDASVTASTHSLLDSLRAAASEPGGLGVRARRLGVSPDAARTLAGVDGRRIVPIAARLAAQAHAAGLLPEIEGARIDNESAVAMVEKDGMRLRTSWDQLQDVKQLRDLAWDEGVRAFPGRPEAAQALQELVLAVAPPNLRYEASTTERLRTEARTAVNPYDGLVRKDEKIIGSHEIATTDHIRKLESLRAWSAHQSPAPDWRTDLPPVLGRLVLIAFLILGFSAYLKLHHPSVYAETPPLLLLAVLSALVMGVGWLVVNQFRGYEMLIPTTVLSLSAALLFGNALAFAATLVASLLIGVVFGLGLPFLTGSALAGIAAIATATGVRRRRDFYRPMLMVALTYALAIAAMGLVDGARLDILLRRMIWGVGAGFASVLAVTVFLPLLETIFTVTTDITLLELADLNRPILRRLMLEAPGTYHHSIVVGTLAESAAAAIGGNPLLARVGAYYHDIGKIDKAEYYVENQSSARNRHEKLSPTMSSLIIQAHVREGAEIARKEKLPKAIVNAILQHHGTTLLGFFYSKEQARRKAEDTQKKLNASDLEVPEAEFRYPGPKPQSKETAVLMLADAVEAAARSLNEPTPGRIRGVVNRILETRVKDGQLDESPITFEDLAKVRDSFIPILTALFHARVHYPGVFAEEPRVRPADNRGQAREGSRLKVDNS